MKDLTKYGTAAAVAAAVGINRTTLDKAMRRGDDRLEVAELFGGQLIVSVASAKQYKRNPPKRGRVAEIK